MRCLLITPFLNLSFFFTFFQPVESLKQSHWFQGPLDKKNGWKCIEISLQLRCAFILNCFRIISFDLPSLFFKRAELVPRGTVNFVSRESQCFWRKSRETLGFEGSKIHCSPRDQSWSELLFSKTKQKQILKTALRFQRQDHATINCTLWSRSTAVNISRGTLSFWRHSFRNVARSWHLAEDSPFHG